MKTIRTMTMTAVCAALAGVANATVYHVGPDGNDAASGLDWANARRTIQAAVNLATVTGDEVVVTNGVYAPITSTGNRSIVIRSVEGATATIIDGGGVSRCATLGTSTGHTNTVLVGFTLRNGRSAQSDSLNGGGVYGGTLHDCVLTGNVAAGGGGGSYYGALFNCLLIGNSGDASAGGGSYYGTLYGCTLSGNVTGGSGGGAFYSTLNNCVVSGNRAANGGGTYSATLNGCTVSGNTAANNGGGTYSGTMNNSIVWGNASVYTAVTNYSSGMFSYTCTAPSTGSSPVNGNPLFRLPEAGDFRLLAGSPCLDRGSASYVFGTTDVLGNVRVQNGTVDVGAYEGVGTLRAGATVADLNATVGRLDGILISWATPSAAVSGDVMRYRVLRLSASTGAWVPVTGWIAEEAFLDVNVTAERAHDYAVVAAFDAGMDEISEMSVPVTGHRGVAYFVDAAKSDDSGDGRSWGTAKRTIQAAINLAVSGETIVVTNGVYAPITATGKALAIQSVNGARFTIIDGGGTNRCATLGTAAATTSVILRGFTLRNGRTAINNAHGGGVWGGTLYDCVITGNTVAASTSTHGGGAYYSVLNNCIVSGNRASGNGGGAFHGTLNNCVVSENVAANGGGAYTARLNNCTVTGNRATSTSDSSGGGVYGNFMNGGAVNNSIVWGNFASGTATNYALDTLAISYTCTAPLPSGTANLMADPLFRFPEIGDYRLTANSPCLERGANASVVGSTDVVGNPRIQGPFVDLGAYEGAASPLVQTTVANLAASADHPDGIHVTWDAQDGAALYRVFRLDTATGRWEPVSGWMAGTAFFDTGTVAFEAYAYAVVTAFDENLDGLSVMSPPVTGQRGFSWFVDASRPDDSGDGKGWATAKKTIQAAIDLAVAGEAIVVTNGVYAPITAANKAILIRSVEGAGATIIDGGGVSRCATLGSATPHTVLVGFALRNGRAATGGGAMYGTLRDCVLADNVATDEGGGAHSSVLYGCTLARNAAGRAGGGAYYGTLNGCIVTGNAATGTGFMSSEGGGGICGSTLDNCVVTGNRTAGAGGGGAYYGTLRNCIVSGNTAGGNGGGTQASTLRNCLVAGNAAKGEGGGVYNGSLYNCTVTRNSAAVAGGGYGANNVGSLNNCIVWGNAVSSGTSSNYSGFYLTDVYYTCISPIVFGPLPNIAEDPLFRYPEAGDFRLLAGSPCIDAGGTFTQPDLVDVLGNPRTQGAKIDMGAYEEAGTVRLGAAVTGLVASTNHWDGIEVSWDAPAGAVRFSVLRLDEATGQWIPISGWIEGTSFLDRWPAVAHAEHAYSVVAAFDAGMDEISEMSVPVTGHRGFSWFVDASRPDDSGDGHSWATAKRTIQTAVSLAMPGEAIAVTNGVYGPVTTANKAILVSSVNGADVTVIHGGGTNRCATLGSQASHTNVILTGFTLTGGLAAGNSDGGGAFYGTLNNCILTGNVATRNGGGAYSSVLNNCTVSWNTATGSGGGAWGGTLNNCTVTENRANNTTSGGGTYNATVNNGIVWANFTSAGATNNYYIGTFRYSCTSPLPSGSVHVNHDPRFRLPEAGDYRLLAGSPCIDAGTNFYAVGSTDIIGNPRIQGPFVDMGAYEGAGTLLANDVVVNLQASTDRQDGIALSWEAPHDGNGTLPPPENFRYRVFRLNAVTGRWEPVTGWIAQKEFLDTRVPAGTDTDYAVVTAFDANLDAISALSPSVTGRRATPDYTETTPVRVPYAWLGQWAGTWFSPWHLGNRDPATHEDFAHSTGANGYYVWESYVANLNPDNPASRFAITNYAVNAEGRVTSLKWAPDHTHAVSPDNRVYTILGKTNLTDTTPWIPTNSATRFIRVRVSLPPE